MGTSPKVNLFLELPPPLHFSSFSLSLPAMISFHNSSSEYYYHPTSAAASSLFDLNGFNTTSSLHLSSSSTDQHQRGIVCWFIQLMPNNDVMLRRVCFSVNFCRSLFDFFQSDLSRRVTNSPKRQHTFINQPQPSSFPGCLVGFSSFPYQIPCSVFPFLLRLCRPSLCGPSSPMDFASTTTRLLVRMFLRFPHSSCKKQTVCVYGNGILKEHDFVTVKDLFGSQQQGSCELVRLQSTSRNSSINPTESSSLPFESSGSIQGLKQTICRDPGFAFLVVSCVVLGGKGGFGSLLRGQKGRKKKTTNFDACRDLQGRRIRHARAAERLQKWLENKEEKRKEDEAEENEIPDEDEAEEDQEIIKSTCTLLDPKYLESFDHREENVKDALRVGLRLDLNGHTSDDTRGHLAAVQEESIEVDCDDEDIVLPNQANQTCSEPNQAIGAESPIEDEVNEEDISEEDFARMTLNFCRQRKVVG